MSKILSTLLFFMMIIALVSVETSAFAEETGIRILSGPEDKTDSVNIDDMKVGDTAQIHGFGEITITSIDYVDTIPTDIDPGSFSTWRGDARSEISSGSQADFLRIRIHILNTQHKPFDFREVFGEVICYYDDDYQFGGWSRQERFQWEEFWTMYEDSESSYAIDPLYEGYYDVVVTLPNYVVKSKESLSVTFSIGDNEFTCNVRK